MPRPPYRTSSGRWAGLRDVVDPSAQPLDRLRLARNVLPVDVTLGTAWLGRPGCTPLGARVAVGRVQWIGQFTRADGTGAIVQHSLVLAAGQLYEFSWITRTWTLRALPVGLTLDPAATIAVVPFAGYLIVSDGVHAPLAWDGTTWVATPCPVAYGPPIVYYAKLFVIMKSDRRTIAWSEEADPLTGYTTDQQWTLAQSDSDPLEAIRGTNEALVVWRARSITAIAGPVSEDFQTAGTREGVSETIGTTSPHAIVPRDREWYFLSADGQPHLYIPGGGVAPVWRDVRETMRRVPPHTLRSAIGTYHAALDLVQLHVREVGEDWPSLGLCISGATQAPIAVVSGYQASAIGELLDGDERPLLVHGTATGHVYVHDTGPGVVWDDRLAGPDGGTRSIVHEVTLPALGHDIAIEKKWDRIDVLVRSEGVLTNITVEGDTPYTTQTLVENLALTEGRAVFDTAVWDTATWAQDRPESRLSVGFALTGRWLVPRIRHDAPGEAFGLTMVEASGWLLQDPPRAR